MAQYLKGITQVAPNVQPTSSDYIKKGAMLEDTKLEETNTESFGWIPAVVSAVASLIGTGLSIHNTNKVNKENKKLYEEEREYNTPVNQRNRLLQAGINPVGTSYQNVSSLSASEQQQTYDSSAIQGISAIPNNIAEIESIRQQNELVKSQTKLNQAQANNIDRKLEFDIEQIKSVVAKNYADIQNAKNIYKLNSDQFEFSKNLENQKLDLEQKSRAATIANLEAATKAINEKLGKELLILDLQGDEIKTRTTNVDFTTKREREMWNISSKFYAKLKEKEANSGGLFNSGFTLADLMQGDSELRKYWRTLARTPLTLWRERVG